MSLGRKLLAATASLVVMSGAAKAENFFNPESGLEFICTSIKGNKVAAIVLDGGQTYNYRGSTVQRAAVIPLNSVRGRGVDMSLYNSVVRDRNAFDKESKDGTIPFMTYIAVEYKGIMMQQGYRQPFQAEGGYELSQHMFMPRPVSRDITGNANSFYTNAYEACSGRTPRYQGMVPGRSSPYVAPTPNGGGQHRYGPRPY
jgi:hypothetical protein